MNLLKLVKAMVVLAGVSLAAWVAISGDPLRPPPIARESATPTPTPTVRAQLPPRSDPRQEAGSVAGQQGPAGGGGPSTETTPANPGNPYGTGGKPLRFGPTAP